MTKMAAMPIYGKNFKNRLLRKQKADDLQTWYNVLGARVLPSKKDKQWSGTNTIGSHILPSKPQGK